MRLKEWLKTGALHALAAICAGPVYGAVMCLMGTDYSFSDSVEITMIYLLLFGAFMSMVLNMSVYKQNLPLALSFGATRKEVFWGMQCYRVVYIVLVVAAAMALVPLTDEPYTMMVVFLPIGLAAMLLMGAIGSVAGVVANRYGKGAALAVGVLLGLLSLGTGIAIGILIVINVEFTVMPKWILWLLPAIGLMLHIGSMVLEHKTIYKYNVKL